MKPKLYYHGTDTEVHLGDIIEYRPFFGIGPKRSGFVAYLPGESDIHPEFEDGGTPEWGIDIGNGDILKIAYVPEELQPPRGLKFISRGTTKNSIMPEDEVL